MLRSLPIAALATLAIAAPAQASPADYVRGAQNADGGFGMTQSGGSSQLATGWALLGLDATGQRPGPAALAYVRRGLPARCARSATSSARCSSCAPPGRTRGASAGAT